MKMYGTRKKIITSIITQLSAYGNSTYSHPGWPNAHVQADHIDEKTRFMMSYRRYIYIYI